MGKLWNKFFGKRDIKIPNPLVESRPNPDTLYRENIRYEKLKKSFGSPDDNNKYFVVEMHGSTGSKDVSAAKCKTVNVSPIVRKDNLHRSGHGVLGSATSGSWVDFEKYSAKSFIDKNQFFKELDSESDRMGLSVGKKVYIPHLKREMTIDRKEIIAFYSYSYPSNIYDVKITLTIGFVFNNDAEIPDVFQSSQIEIPEKVGDISTDILENLIDLKDTYDNVEISIKDNESSYGIRITLPRMDIEIMSSTLNCLNELKSRLGQNYVVDISDIQMASNRQIGTRASNPFIDVFVRKAAHSSKSSPQISLSSSESLESS